MILCGVVGFGVWDEWGKAEPMKRMKIKMKNIPLHSFYIMKTNKPNSNTYKRTSAEINPVRTISVAFLFSGT